MLAHNIKPDHLINLFSILFQNHFLISLFVSLLAAIRKLLSITVKYPHPRSKLSFAPPQAICEQIVQRGETLEIFAPVKIIML